MKSMYLLKLKLSLKLINNNNRLRVIETVAIGFIRNLNYVDSYNNVIYSNTLIFLFGSIYVNHSSRINHNVYQSQQ